MGEDGARGFDVTSPPFAVTVAPKVIGTAMKRYRKVMRALRGGIRQAQSSGWFISAFLLTTAGLGLAFVCRVWPQEVFTYLLAAVTITVSIYGFSIAARINLKNKITDCVMGCNARYDDLYKERSRIEEQFIGGTISQKNISIVQNYYNRYWGLKSDQFDYWLSGYVDPETMCSWFYSVMKAFALNPTVGPWSFSKGWESSSAYHRVADPMFDEFIERLIDIANAHRPMIEEGNFNRSEAMAIYRDVIALFRDTEAQYAATIGFMTNIPLRGMIAPRQSMKKYLKEYSRGPAVDA